MKLIVPASFGLGICVLLLASNRAVGSGQTGALVRLQPTSPGASQIGNANISGILRTGQLVTSGSVPSGGAIHGINASTASGIGVLGEATATSGAATGVRGINSAPSGSGVNGYQSSLTGTTYGLSGSTESNGGRGVAGFAYATTGSTYGGYFQSLSSSGRAVYGAATSLTGGSYGGYFFSSSSSGTAVFGDASSSLGGTFGGYFVSRSTGGQAVHAVATASSGATYGVVGEVLSANGYGLYFLGRLAGSGFKSFRIDHPADPLNKYLLHYCAEGPVPQNIYNGSVKTDAKGYATVNLPDYYEEINKDARIQVSVVDEEDSQSFALAKVVQKVNRGQFVIRTSEPNVEVFWEVKATRNDAFARLNGAPVTEEKPPAERGKYQDPKLYGAPAEMGIHYRPLEKGSKRSLQLGGSL